MGWESTSYFVFIYLKKPKNTLQCSYVFTSIYPHFQNGVKCVLRDFEEFKNFNPIHHEQIDHHLQISYCWKQALLTAKLSPKKKNVSKISSFTKL